MKIHWSTLRPLIRHALFFVVCQGSRAAVSVVDTFDQAGISAIPPDTVVQDVNLPFGSRRSFEFSFGGIGSQWTTNTLTVDAAAGKLSYVVNGTSTVDTRPLGVALAYSGSPEVHSILGSSGFILGFSELSGVGTLFVEFGSSAGLVGVQRMGLTGPGEIFFPVSSIYANPGHTVDAFSVLRFAFEARSQQFSFTLDEIRLIPEPGAAVFLCVVGAGWLSLRRRGAQGKQRE